MLQVVNSHTISALRLLFEFRPKPNHQFVKAWKHVQSSTASFIFETRGLDLDVSAPAYSVKSKGADPWISMIGLHWKRAVLGNHPQS